MGSPRSPTGRCCRCPSVPEQLSWGWGRWGIAERWSFVLGYLQPKGEDENAAVISALTLLCPN